MKHYLLLAVLMLLALTTTAQYKVAVDARGGEYYGGLSLVVMPAPHQAVELMAVRSYDRKRARVACYYEEHYKFFNSKWLSYYGGVGLHLGARTEQRYYPDAADQSVRVTRVLFGTDLIGGLETKIPNTPIRIAVDVIPYIDLILQGSYIDGSLRVGVQF